MAKDQVSSHTAGETGRKSVHFALYVLRCAWCVLQWQYYTKALKKEDSAQEMLAPVNNAIIPDVSRGNREKRQRRFVIRSIIIAMPGVIMLPA